MTAHVTVNNKPMPDNHDNEQHEKKEINTARVVYSAQPTDYVLMISNGELVKITVADLKKSLK